MVKTKHNKAKKNQVGMKHSIQQIGTGGQKATLIMPLKSYRVPSSGLLYNFTRQNRNLRKTQPHRQEKHPLKKYFKRILTYTSKIRVKTARTIHC